LDHLHVNLPFISPLFLTLACSHTKAWLIDFDYARRMPTTVPNELKTRLPERFPLLDHGQQALPLHDLFSLVWGEAAI
jgi:hypothetical protein